MLKKRITLSERGKRSGARLLVAFRMNHRIIFIHGFSKNNKENISKNDELHLKLYAKTLLNFTEHQLKEAIKLGELIEVI
ncbi:MAG: type II toxin-antitoxin system RelE/ParE family toxin [Legionellales bacterium]|nr:type II toxin-antitoxin system RelE/ParE family toxin [Legionellales bacterium]